MPALLAKMGIWEFLIVVGLILFLFWPLIAALTCALLKMRRQKDEAEARRRGRRDD